jgi:hypothetical protein
LPPITAPRRSRCPRATGRPAGLFGNRRLKHAIHMPAVIQIRHRHSDGRVYYERKLAEGKTPEEALRSLNRARTHQSGTSSEETRKGSRHKRASIWRKSYRVGAADRPVQMVDICAQSRTADVANRRSRSRIGGVAPPYICAPIRVPLTQPSLPFAPRAHRTSDTRVCGSLERLRCSPRHGPSCSPTARSRQASVTGSGYR